MLNCVILLPARVKGDNLIKATGNNMEISHLIEEWKRGCVYWPCIDHIAYFMLVLGSWLSYQVKEYLETDWHDQTCKQQYTFSFSIFRILLSGRLWIFHDFEAKARPMKVLYTILLRSRNYDFIFPYYDIIISLMRLFISLFRRSISLLRLVIS